MSKVVGIKFKNTPKVYYFAPKEVVEIFKHLNQEDILGILDIFTSMGTCQL